MSPKERMSGPDRSEEEFRDRVRVRLREFIPRFLTIRASMGMGAEVGFGSLPSAHGVFSLGVLTQLQKEDGRWGYLTQGFLFPEVAPLKPQDREGILVMPAHVRPGPRLVSVFQRKGHAEQGVFEPRLLRASDSVLEGVVAHELAHMFECGKPKTKRVQQFLTLREREMAEYMDRDDDRMFDRFDQTDEAVYDVIAGLYGYKDQVLAKIDYMIGCLRRYGDARKTGYSMLKTSGTAIEELTVRRHEVLRYC